MTPSPLPPSPPPLTHPPNHTLPSAPFQQHQCTGRLREAVLSGTLTPLETDSVALLEALYDLTTPSKQLWDVPFARVVAFPPAKAQGGGGDGDGAVVLHVYVSRLLFYLIAYDGIKVVMEAIRTWGCTGPEGAEAQAQLGGGAAAAQMQTQGDNGPHAPGAPAAGQQHPQHTAASGARPAAGVRVLSGVEDPAVVPAVFTSTYHEEAAKISAYDFTLGGLLKSCENLGCTMAAQPDGVRLQLKP